MPKKSKEKHKKAVAMERATIGERDIAYKDIHNWENPSCPRCGYEVTQKSGFQKAKRGKVQQFRCLKCKRRFLEDYVYLGVV